jgi:molecular chaperone DnaK
VQGERKLANDNFTLGRFMLTGIPPAPRGIPQVEVTFDIDANGIIHVTAKDLGTGNEQAITIKGSKKLSDEEINRMVDDAKKYEEEDNKKKQEIEVRNNADMAIFSAEKLLKESEENIEEEDKTNIRDHIEKMKTALEGTDSEAIQKQMEELTEAVFKVTTKIYQKVQSEQAARKEEGDTSSDSDDNVVDADFTEKKE